MADSSRITPSRLGGRLGYMEARRHDIERVQEFVIKPNRVSGFHEIAFVGTALTQEALIEIDFPVWFVDKPGISFSAELVRDIIEEGNFPTISVVVVSWKKAHDVRPGGGYFIGANIAVVASGREGEQMIVHWQAEGKALKLTG